MKLIKLLVTMSLINAILVMGIAQFSSRSSVPAVQNTIPSPSPLQDSVSVEQTPLPTATTMPSSVPGTAKSLPTKTPIVATPTPAPTVTPTHKPTGCVIQIDGVSYEITSLRQTHSGGDVFQCGTDMSALFWKKHNQNILKVMQQYKI